MEEDGADLIGKVNTRGPKRDAMREEDPLIRAKRRTAELRDHLGEDHDGTDDFYIAPSDIPNGWSYEWKRKTIMGQEDPAYQVALARAGWDAVPAARHPSYMPDTGNYATIERKGMVLMERPAEISEEARSREDRKARSQVRQKEEQLTASKSGEFDRNNKGEGLTKIRKSYESLPVPD